MSKQFTEQLEAYRLLVEEQIDAYIASQSADELITAGTYHELLRRGGKRIRGALVINGYTLCGGTDMRVALQAALAVEMMHAYILIIDDIQDRSDTRRGGPTAHKMIEAWSEQQQWSGNHGHTGVSLALNSALYGAHKAQQLFSSLDVATQVRLDALDLMNSTMAITALGQTGDIVNEVKPTVLDEDINDVLIKKTAHYTMLNPLQIGMCLAGASREESDDIAGYALQAGRAFQMIDDLLVFSDADDKRADQDIKEGKITLLSHYALSHAPEDDAVFLRSQLGNQSLTSQDFERCRTIMIDAGARDYAVQQAGAALDEADASLRSVAHDWDQDSIQFLHGLTDYLRQKIVT